MPGTDVVVLPDNFALSHDALAEIAPDYEAMRRAIAKCEHVDEIARFADIAVAAQAYYRQSRDVENEIRSSRIRVRAERRLGELLNRMRESGERDRGGRSSGNESRSATLSDLGIPRDRASRATQLADVPEEEFEAALEEPTTAQPRRILREIKEKRDVTPKPLPHLVPIEQTLDLLSGVETMGRRIEAGELPPLHLWRANIEPHYIAQLRKYIPMIVTYLSTIQLEIERESA